MESMIEGSDNIINKTDGIYDRMLGQGQCIERPGILTAMVTANFVICRMTVGCRSASALSCQTDAAVAEPGDRLKRTGGGVTDDGLPWLPMIKPGLGSLTHAALMVIRRDRRRSWGLD